MNIHRLLQKIKENLSIFKDFIISFSYLIRVQFKLLPVPHCFHNVIRTLNETFQKIFIASLNNNYTSYHTVQISCFCTLLNYTVYISFMSKILNISNHSKKMSNLVWLKSEKKSLLCFLFQYCIAFTQGLRFTWC